jgi:hypothetical protein
VLVALSFAWKFYRCLKYPIVFIFSVILDGSESVNLVPTQLGSAVVASALSPDEGLAVFAELQKARRCFVLENELHTVYLVSWKRQTPCCLRCNRS